MNYEVDVLLFVYYITIRMSEVVMGNSTIRYLCRSRLHKTDNWNLYSYILNSVS